ncbi:MAG: aspartate-semialdehyde dehydrogenase [Myxococcota bacterium]
MRSDFHVAVVGASGLVGRKMVEVLEKRRFPLKRLSLFASSRSAGDIIEFNGEEIEIQDVEKMDSGDIDIALFSAGAERALKYAPIFAEAGALVIDNSSAFRMQSDIPLIVPEVNGKSLRKIPARRIISNPNCSTAQLVLALHPLHQYATLKRVVVSSYQSVSGAGKRAIDELEQQVIDLFNGRTPTNEHFPHIIAFNCIPHIDLFDAAGYTKEERKMIDETRKILDIPDLKVTATCVRVPVFYSHAEAVTAEFENEITPDTARGILSKTAGVSVIDNPTENAYPLQNQSAGNDEVFVGRIRRDESALNSLNMWIVADNLLKGAALNAVQIAELAAPLL